MKKSELYKLAQCSVLECAHLTTETKLEILRVLISDEDVALFSEKQKEQQEMVLCDGGVGV